MVKSVEDTNLSSTAGNPFIYYGFRNFSGSGGYFAKKNFESDGTKGAGNREALALARTFAPLSPKNSRQCSFFLKKIAILKNNPYLCTVTLIIHLNRMLMKKKKSEKCVKSGKMLGSVEHFNYFCR